MVHASFSRRLVPAPCFKIRLKTASTKTGN
jgi:hypothetical protein